MQIKRTIVVVALAAASLTGTSAWAKPTATNYGRVSNADRKWLMAAADGELKEISLGHLVTKRADNPAVRNFAKQMIRDHTKAQGELARLAASKGVALPTHLGKENRDLLRHLTRLSPSRLSHDYIQNSVNDHYKDVADFSHEVKNGDDKDVRAWAKKTLPVLQMHLQMARTTARGIVSKRKV